MITKEEVEMMMRSESRFERKRGKSILLSDKTRPGRLFRYYVARKRFWHKVTHRSFWTTDNDAYALVRGLFLER